MGRRREQYAKRGEAQAVEPIHEREALERRWFRRSEFNDGLTRLVTGADAAHEPYHRWLPYTQGFAPQLVRMFLETTGASEDAGRPLLDPFSGSGAFPIECARRGVAAIGVEASPALVFLTNAIADGAFPPLPDLRRCRTWQDAAALLEAPLHRAALMLGWSRRFSRAGALMKDAPPLPIVFNDIVRVMRADLASEPLPRPPQALVGDARALSEFRDGSVGGVLTSPPYLSRHDYTKITRPLRRVYAAWRPETSQTAERATQVRAHPRAYRRDWEYEVHPAVAEVIAALQQKNLVQLAGVARSYFEDMRAFLGELQRVLSPGAPAWVVIGGARVRDVYVPGDSILAEIAEACGMQLEKAVIARRLIPAGRKLGALRDVAPRESILMLRK